jgi:heme exporter protein A
MTAMSDGAAENAAVLEISDLALSRGGRMLVDGLTLALAAGEALLLRGPNGAGKSSLLLALAGVLRPDRGRIDWRLGETPQLHYFGHAPALKPQLTLAETLKFWRALNGTGDMAVEAALEQMGLAGLGAIEAGHLSAGQGRRLGLARLLLSPRKIWLLDEPTASLDADGRARVAQMIDAHLADGGAAIVATHDDLGLAGPTETLTLGASR